MTDSTILIKSPDGWKVKAAVGLGGLAVVVILAFLYRVEVGLIVLSIGGAVGARVWVWAVHAHKLANFERRRWLADVIKAEAEAAAAKARSYFVETNTGVFVLDGIAISQFYPAVSASKLLADIPLPLPEPEPPVKRLLDIVWPHILILGPTGSGKTTVANHLIDAAEYDAIIYALDPHATQNRLKGLPWSPRARVIGDGRDWPAIDTMLVSLLVEMDNRFKQRPDPLLPTPYSLLPIYIANDEWLAVLKNCPHAREFFETIGSEAAKVNMHLMIATQAATVDDLGCSAAVRDNLVELRLDHALKAHNRGELRWGKRRDSIEVVELPGRYRAVAPFRAVTEPMPTQEAVEPLPILDAGPVPPVPTEEELRVFELHQQGKLPYAIYKELYPDRTYGGNQANEIKAILARFGVRL